MPVIRDSAGGKNSRRETRVVKERKRSYPSLMQVQSSALQWTTGSRSIKRYERGCCEKQRYERVDKKLLREIHTELISSD